MQDSTTISASILAADRYTRFSLYLLLLFSVLILVSTGKLDLFSIVVAPAALLVKGYRWWRGKPPELTHRTATLLVVAYFAFFPVDLWIISRALASNAPNPALYSALLAAIHLLLFAVAVRLFSARTTRDYLFLSLLGFAAILAAAILTVNTTFMVLFMLFLLVAVSTFIGLEMQRSSAQSAAVPAEIDPPATRRLHRALALTSIAVAAGSLVLGTGIFFVLPRLAAGYLSGLSLQPTLISGFTNDVQLGQIGRIKKNTALVMRVKVRGGALPSPRVRWRGVVLTTFDGRRWFNDEHSPVAMTPSAGGIFAIRESPPAVSPYGRSVQYTILLEPIATDALFVAPQAISMRGLFSNETGPSGLTARRNYLLIDKTFSIQNPFHNYGNVRYEGFSLFPAVPPRKLREASAIYSQEFREAYLQLPNLDPRIPDLARRVTSAAPNPYDKASAIESYLQVNYGYTLDLTGSPGDDPLAHFLFERRAGHCEYFAAAMTVMLRSVGVPARYVNGFLPGDYNDVGEDYVVRASDAHSWVEVYFPEYGWITFDPTPAAPVPAKGMLAHLANYWDWFELTWHEWIINYDFAHQRTLAENMQRASRSRVDQIREYFARLRQRCMASLLHFETAGICSPYFFGLLAFVFLCVLLLRFRAFFARLWILWRLRVLAPEAAAPRLATLQYRQMLGLLQRGGWKKPPHQTPLEFAASLPSSSVGVPVTELTVLYQQSRFGARAGATRRIDLLLADIKQLLRPRANRPRPLA